MNLKSLKTASTGSSITPILIFCFSPIANEENNEDNGASPSFPEPQNNIRQERRKLDFNNLENSTSPVTTSNPRKFRRCISMFESGPSPSLQLNKNKSSPGKLNF